MSDEGILKRVDDGLTCNVRVIGFRNDGLCRRDAYFCNGTCKAKHDRCCSSDHKCGWLIFSYHLSLALVHKTVTGKHEWPLAFGKCVVR